MDTEYRRFVSADAELLASFLTEQQWPYHGKIPDRGAVLRQVADGYYDSSSARTFWIIVSNERAGLIRLFDLDDGGPLFDLRIRAEHRGRGLGGQAVAWLTQYLFTELPGLRRIEGTTRQDNQAMRRVFRRCGYAKEAHYRDAWPGPGDQIHDAVGYAILRRDWAAGTVTTPHWDDEPG
ncbi:MAG: GNAT family N-acetyltransferase [Streptosporangiaceae bacterium]